MSRKVKLLCQQCGNQTRFRIHCRELIVWDYDASREGAADAKWLDHEHIGDVLDQRYEVFCSECRTKLGDFEVGQL